MYYDWHDLPWAKVGFVVAGMLLVAVRDSNWKDGLKNLAFCILGPLTLFCALASCVEWAQPGVPVRYQHGTPRTAGHQRWEDEMDFLRKDLRESGASPEKIEQWERDSRAAHKCADRCE